MVNTNAAGAAHYEGSALLHFRFNADGFELVDAPFFAKERITDARSFSDPGGQVLAIYTKVFEEVEELIGKRWGAVWSKGLP